MPTTDHTDFVPPDVAPAAWQARLLFALGRQRIAVTFILFLLSFGLAVGSVVLLAGVTDKRHMAALVMTALFSTAGLSILAIFQPWLPRLATKDHISAALGTATIPERTYLIPAIESWLARRYWPRPMTLLELCTLFNGIRDEHGERARRRRTKAAQARDEQLQSLATFGARAQIDGLEQSQI